MSTFSLLVVAVILLFIITICISLFTVVFIVGGIRLMKVIKEIRNVNKNLKIFQSFIKRLILKE